MAKINKNKGKKKQQQEIAKAVKKPPVKKTKGGDEDKFTWEDIAAMSDSDDDNDGIDEAIETSAKAKNLRKAITNNLGGLLTSLEKEKMNNSEEEEFEEHDLDASSVEEEEEDDEEEDDEAKETEGNDDNSNAEKNESFIDQIKNNVDGDNNDSDSDEEEEDEDKEGTKVEKKYKKLQDNNYINSKALSVVAAELTSIQSKLPWAETFVIVPPTPLPFGENGDPESNPLDIHDDLKREVAFYNTALEAVNLARPKCQEFGIPFSRPEDFFVEMVKTDGKLRRRRKRIVNNELSSLPCNYWLVLSLEWDYNCLTYFFLSSFLLSFRSHG